MSYPKKFPHVKSPPIFTQHNSFILHIFSIFVMPEVIKAASCGSIIKKPRFKIYLEKIHQQI